MTENWRPQISIYIAASIDGYIARLNDGLDWLEPFQNAEEDYGYHTFLSSVDVLILGRKTYEVVSSIPEWPYKEKRVIVLSKTLPSVKKEAELYNGDLLHLVSELFSDGFRHVWVDGGVTISQFLTFHLVDQLILSVIPIILGAGIPLFNTIGRELPCQLICSQAYPNGLVQSTYEVLE